MGIKTPQDILLEKLIRFNGGKSYGQIVFLAGGAGSGKGFTIQNFIEGDKFKVRDVDDLKMTFKKIAAIGKFKLTDLLSKYGDRINEKDRSLIDSELIQKSLDITDLNLKNPTHVYLLHILVRATGAKEKTLYNLLTGVESDRLPNIIFDTTLADMSDLNEYLPMLISVGYNPKDIHITWVLTNYKIAIQQNLERDRVVPQDILLKTHRGAAKTMMNLLNGNLPPQINGGIYIILGNRENSIFWETPDGKTILTKGVSPITKKKERPTIRKFTYITIKTPGETIISNREMKGQLFDWIVANAPSDVFDPPV